jgi:hypothetical protein
MEANLDTSSVSLSTTQLKPLSLSDEVISLETKETLTSLLSEHDSESVQSFS